MHEMAHVSWSHPWTAGCWFTADSRDASAPQQAVLWSSHVRCRRAMVRSMTAAHEVPNFHFCDEVNLGALIQLRTRLQGDPALAGTKVLLCP